MDLKTYIHGIQPGRFGFPALMDRAFKIFVFTFLIFLSSKIRSQDVVYWSSSASNGNWDWGSLCTAAGVDGNWHYTTNGNGERKRPDCFATPNTVNFDNTYYPVMNLNSPNDYTLNQILFVSGTNDRTINTDALRSIWFKENGLINAKIENLASSTTHTFNVSVNIDAAAQMEINPVWGYLVFNNPVINASPNPILIWGNTGSSYAGDNVYFNGDISGTAGITINQNATVVYDVVQKTYTGPTTINASTFLQIKSNQTLGDVYAYGTITVDAGVTLTITGTWTGGGTIVNNGTIVLAGSAAQSFPGSSTTVSAMQNLTINNASGVTLDKDIIVSGTLALTNGILNTTGNLLTIANTGASGITGGSTTSYINGPVVWNLPATLAVGSSYVFPLGKGGSYYPMAVTDPTTGSGTINLRAEVFASNSGGTPGQGSLSTLSTTEYWSLISSGNLTDHKISLTRQSPLGTMNRIGRSTTLMGAYFSVGGTASGTSIINSNSTGAGLTQYFIMAKNCVAPSVPNITASVNPVCEGSNTTLNISSGNLNDATSWQWYTASCGGTPAGNGSSITISPNISTTYFARGEGGCVVPDVCGSLPVSVNPTPAAPAGDASQYFCTSATVANLVAVGTAVKWYTNPSGGLPLGSGAPLVNTSRYYASQTIGNCESTSRLSVQVFLVSNSNITGFTGPPSPCPNTPITYSVNLVSGTTYTWSIPDGWSASSSLSGLNLNSISVSSGVAGNNGNIKVIAQNACRTDSAFLAVSVTPAPAVSINSDYCVGNNQVKLTALPGSSPTYSYQWTSNGTNYSTDQAITVGIAAVYKVKVTSAATGCFASATTTLSKELVKNGNFELGNDGSFTSQYTYQPYMPGDTSLHHPEGKYAIGTDPQKYHRDFYGRDHTSNTGNFMIINGVPNSVVWGQQINDLIPGTKYYFSAWAMSLANGPPFAQLRFRINGVQVGSIVTLPGRPPIDGPPYNWLQFYGDWTPGAGVTSANLEIIDLQTSLKGNDFGLDDISFGTLSPTLMSIAAIANGGTPVCEGGTIDLSVSINGGRPPYFYTWTGPNGPIPPVQYPSISDVSLADTGTYRVIIKDSYGCKDDTAFAKVKVFPMPTAYVSGSTILCKDPTSASVTFTGDGSLPNYTFMFNMNGVADSTTTISGNNISIPVSAAVAGDYTYTLTKVIDNNGCSQLQTSAATISIKEVIAKISGTASVCNGAPAPEVTFTASGWRASPPFTFTYRINGGANLSVNANSGNCVSISAPTGVSGTFVYELISVSGASGCSSTASGTAIITIYPTPTVTGTNSACVNQNGIVYTTESGMTNYAWTISGGIIASGQGSNSITVNWGAQGAQNISVNYTNTHGCAAATPTSYTVYVGDMWIGTTSDWNDPDNWCAGVPTAAQDVVIPGSAAVQPQIMSAAAVCHDLILNGASASLQINAGQTLTINGNLVNNGGNLTINSDALSNNGSLIVEGAGTGTGSVTYKRYLEPNRWFISSPSLNNGFSYTGSAIATAGDGTYDFAPFNEGANTWDYINPPMRTTLNPGLGYLLRLSTGNYVQYFGSLNGDISKSLPSTSSYTGWNAAGNPYTSAIRIKDEGSYLGFISQNATALDANYRAVYIWNQTGSYSGAEQFYTVIANTGYSGKTYQGLLPDTYVQAGQGFLVNLRYSGGTPATVIFRKGTVDNGALDGMQVHSTGTSLKRAETSWPGITLLATTGSRTRSTVVAFSPDMTTGLDPSYDAGLLSVSDFNLYTRLVAGNNETNFAIQSLPDNNYQSLEVPIGLDMPQAGQITFKADGIILPDGVYPVIEDRLTHTHVALKTLNDSLTANQAESSWGTGRFFLHFGNTSTLDLNEQRQVQLFTAFYSSQEIILLGTPEAGSHAWLYDVNGRKLGGEYLLTSINKNIIPARGLANGIYLLRIEGKTTQQTLKVTVLNR